MTRLPYTSPGDALDKHTQDPNAHGPLPIEWQLANGEWTMSTDTTFADSGSFGLTPSSGTLHLQYFVAKKSWPGIKYVNFTSAGTAGANITTAQVGIYSVASGTTPNLTLLAKSTAQAGFAAAYNANKIALSSPVPIIQGNTYAVGILQYGTSSPTPGSLFGSWYVFQYHGLLPRRCMSLASQTSLPSTITDSSLSASGLRVQYALTTS